jgi:hypothetical protein
MHELEQSPPPLELTLTSPAPTPVAGHPIGNGRMGTMVWTTPDTIELQINRVDVFAVSRHTRGRRFDADDPSTDYGGACGRISIRVGDAPFAPGPAFTQRLSLEQARCTISGEGVQAECWVAADHDVLVVTLNDARDNPAPVEVTLQMWRAPEVRHGEHSAVYDFRDLPEGLAVVQVFREDEYRCASAVAVGSAGGEVQTATDERARTLCLPASRGTRQILIASAASWEEANDPAQAAQALLDLADSPGGLQALSEGHLRWWQDFWQRTAVKISSPDGTGERAVRDRQLYLYHMASTSRGAFPPKWNGSIFLTDGDARGWGSQFWLWTTEMLYWPLPAADAADLTDPFFNMYQRQLPALETAARQRWEAAGIFLPETVPFDGPAQLPEALVPEYRDLFLRRQGDSPASPALASRCLFDFHLRTLLYPSGDPGPAIRGYSWISHVTSSAAELAVHAWWRYRYTGDIGWLHSHAYPFLRGVAEFYRSLVRPGDDGHRHLHGTNAHEDFWGVTDSIMDLAAIRGTVPLALRAAEILDTDGDLCGQWRSLFAELAPYPMGSDPRAQALTGAVLDDEAWAAGYLGEVDGSHNPEDVQLTPIFPFEDWTLVTQTPDVDAVVQRTMALAPRHRRVLDGEALNTAIRSPIAAVRAGLGEQLPAMLASYRTAFSPLDNGFSLFEQVTPGYQAHSIEHLGLLTMALQEALLQSVSPRPGEPEIIAVFPAWPREWDAEFRLLARGGFMVQARFAAGTVEWVTVHSRRGETCRLRNPWGCPCTVAPQPGPSQEHEGEVLSFETQAGVTYEVSPGR